MKKFLLLFSPFLFILGACADDNSIDDRNRYFQGVEVIELPVLQYDADGSPPDLRIDIKRSSVNFWEFSTNTRNDANRLPAFLSFFNEILSTDEFYEIRLVDEDLGELSDDEIFFWEFQAIQEGNNGIIEFFGDNGELVLVLEYDLK
jgi:hypothetical protein